MKNRSKWIIISLILMIILTSCESVDGNIKEKIQTPTNDKPPIQGKWKIVSKINIEKENSIEKEDLNIGNEALFRNESVIIGKDYTTEPSFRIKNISLEDYLLYKYNKDYKDLDIEDQKVQVITILNEDQYFYELIKMNDDNLIVYIDDSFYMMERIAEEVSLAEVERYIEVEESMIQTVESWNEGDLKTGLLLGFRIPTYDEKNDFYDWKYETVWIHSKDRKIQGKYKLNDLLLPRKNGFWTVSTERQVSEELGTVNDVIISTPQTGSSHSIATSESEEDNFFDLGKMRKDKKESLIQKILFLGNDHISVERIEIDEKEKERRVLETYTLDNLSDRRPIKLSDFIGEEEAGKFIEGAESVMKITDDVSVNETNIAISRRDGYWTFTGRLNYVENEIELYKDFNIKAIPPIEIVRYDKLAMPWNEIRANVYSAQDVFSSPNEDILVVKTNNKLLVFPIVNGKFESKEPLAKIDIPENASIIMAEWATGMYPELWEKEIIKREGIEIE